MIKDLEVVKKAIDGSGELMVSLQFEPYQSLSLRPDYLLDLVSEKKIIHLGCTDHVEIIQMKMNAGNYLHSLLTYVSSKCIGIDINKEALKYIKHKGITNVFYGDITLPGIKEIEEDHYDFLLLGEILEHVENPVDFLKKIVQNYGDSFDKLVITVPNAFGLPFLLNAYNNGKEEVNSDHKYWFTPFTLLKVAFQAGLKMIDLKMCLYETSKSIITGPEVEKNIKSKPLLLDTIVIICDH